MFSRILTAAAVSCFILPVTALSVSSQDMSAAEAYEHREEAMEAMGKMAKTIGEMLKGTTEFDAAAANAALAHAKDELTDFASYFPEGSIVGKSEASPKIWEDPDGFAAAVEKVQADLAAAVAANPQTKQEVQAAFGQVAGNCKACHEKYRVQK